MKIAIGSDHGGFELKEEAKEALRRRGIQIEDVGSRGRDSVDYPDFAAAVAERVSGGAADQGVLVCTTGIGMSIVANKFPGVRAALCLTPQMARAARAHNDANVLTMGESLTSAAEMTAILDAWLETPFSAEPRHARRVGKIGAAAQALAEYSAIRQGDPEVYAIFRDELRRQQVQIDLIASENYASRAVRQAQGSHLTNKYAEGYPGKRWYNGCELVDAVERVAIERAKALFGAEHANVQPNSGSGANMAVYFAVLKPGDQILAMSLAHGGHLTHGHPVNFSGHLFRVASYGVNRETERIDYDEVDALAQEKKPRLIVAGASAYSRVIDFARLRQIADGAGAYLLVDMAHIAGLVAGGCHPSPVPYCEFVTATTHKTLRGPRSGLILCRKSFAEEIDRQIFPGIQGGPLMHTVAAKAVCFHEAMQPSFREYQQQVVRNAQTIAQELAARGLRIVSGGTDNHLMLVDLASAGITGRDAATALEKVSLVVNKNAIPFDTRSPMVTSGIRIGTPAATTRGMKEPEMRRIAAWIADVLQSPADESRLAAIRDEVLALAAAFPAP